MAPEENEKPLSPMQTKETLHGPFQFDRWQYTFSEEEIPEEALQVRIVRFVVEAQGSAVVEVGS